MQGVFPAECSYTRRDVRAAGMKATCATHTCNIVTLGRLVPASTFPLPQAEQLLEVFWGAPRSVVGHGVDPCVLQMIQMMNCSILANTRAQSAQLGRLHLM